MKNIQIVIDGPAGAGKSTISKLIAKKFNFLYIDTGAMYRAVGLKALRNNFDTKSDTEKIIKMMDDIDISISHGDDGQHIYLDGEDVTSK